MIRFRLPTFLVVGLLGAAACQRFPGAQAAAANRSPDTLLTKRYAELIQAELTATDRVAALKAKNCEGLRLTFLLGPDRAGPLIKNAERRAYRENRAAMALRDSILGGRAYL